jgi:tetratricopeptide (TPR) repeat protein
MLQNGIGAILAAQGDYTASLSAFLESHETAYRVGSDRIYLQAAGNVSLSLVRLGDYEQAIDWADRVLTQDNTDSVLPFCFAARSSALLAHAMLGEAVRAEQLMQETKQKIVALRSRGLLQAWSLYSADAYRILGRFLEADSETRYATMGDNAQLHMEFCAGPYARALARNAASLGDLSLGCDKLDNLYTELRQYDVIDRAEILNARCWLHRKKNTVLDKDLVSMYKYLKELPSAVSNQLRSMGMLTSDMGNSS